MDETSQVALDTGDPNEEAAAKTRTFVSKATFPAVATCEDSARLIFGQNEDSNGVETQRRLYKKFSLPGATRNTTQPCHLLVATLLNIGALQQHLSLNARL